MDEAQTRRRNTVNALLDGYGSLSVPQLLMSTTPDFYHQVLPESLGMMPRNREAFAQHAAGIFNVFDEFRMVPKSIVDDGPGNMAVVHARMQGMLKGGAGEWINECVMMIQLSPDGTLVSRVTEFVDSAKALEMARKHAPDNFDVNYSKLDGGGMRTEKGNRNETTGSKSMTLLFGLGLAQVITVISLLYLGRRAIF
ncbi:putative cytochrome p450 protein [Daldinia childiae]|uniref:putative cytochrome p450 protein n=1 Tax=Daldinia childiae TaxID=326645 RepID=UPI001444B5D7|nr:putative cytochrome p450 protein [Daldinia childiae]KAF3064968.1 putative cytochrome p450 protein [Daldinia childiae]